VITILAIKECEALYIRGCGGIVSEKCRSYLQGKKLPVCVNVSCSCDSVNF
jgi:hypothetical protein